MSLKKFLRVRLTALAGAFLIALVLCGPTLHAAYAQAPAAHASAVTFIHHLEHQPPPLIPLLK